MITRRALTSILLAPTLAQAMPSETNRLITEFSQGKTAQRRNITLEMNALVENGNSVSVRIKVNYPMEKDNFISQIALFNEKNPQSEVAYFTLSPANGKAEVATRIRLATTQTIHALALTNKGEVFITSKEAIVTLAACLEE